MANRFVFPPPPPPPPPAAPSQELGGARYSSQQNQWTSRGRGNFGGSRGRGRGGYGGDLHDRSGQKSGYSYQQRNAFREQDSSRSSSYNQLPAQNQAWQMSSQHANSSTLISNGSNGLSMHNNPPTIPSSSIYSNGTKRPHEQAFPRKAAFVKTQVAPSVPSFGPPLIHINTQPKQSPAVTAPQAIPSKRNMLGLTPMDDVEEPSDEDEEAKLASMANVLDKESSLSFSYRGKLSTLKSPEDIAAWIAERRRNYPTKARGEIIAKRKAEEREKILQAKQAAKQKLQEARQNKQSGKKDGSNDKTKKRLSHDLVRQDGPSKSTGGLSKEQMKIEKLRKAMEKNAKKLAKLEAATKKPTNSETEAPADPKQTLDTNLSVYNSEDDTTTISSISDNEMTSSSGSSSDEDSESDSSSESDGSEVLANKLDEHDASDSDAPQELASSRKSPIRVAAPKRNRSDTRPICRNLKRYGKCTRKFCKFRHTEQGGAGKSRSKARDNKPAEKLSLYQRLLKQQIEEDERAEKENKKLEAATESTPDAV